MMYLFAFIDAFPSTLVGCCEVEISPSTTIDPDEFDHFCVIFCAVHEHDSCAFVSFVDTYTSRLTYLQINWITAWVHFGTTLIEVSLSMVAHGMGISSL